MSTTKEVAQQADDIEEALSGLDVLSAVNLDEVTLETILVKVRHYTEEEVTDDKGNPVLDESGTPYKCRFPSLRTAALSLMVPMSIYNEMLLLDKKLDKSNPVTSLDLMADVVLKIWKISEPWMTKEKLIEGVEGPYIIRLFRIFFARTVKSMSGNKA